MYFSMYWTLLALLGVAVVECANIPSFNCVEYAKVHVVEYEFSGTNANVKFSTDINFDKTTILYFSAVINSLSWRVGTLGGNGYWNLKGLGGSPCDGRLCYTVTLTFGLDVSDANGFYFEILEMIVQQGTFSGTPISNSFSVYDTFKIEESPGLSNHYAETSSSTCSNPQWKHSTKGVSSSVLRTIQERLTNSSCTDYERITRRFLRYKESNENFLLQLAGGDPHFLTWDGVSFDYMGACDLVLVKNAKLSNGDPLNIHIRTMVERWWSFIESVAIQIGQNILEIGVNRGQFLVDGLELTDDQFTVQAGVTVEKHFLENYLTKALHFTYVVNVNDMELLRVNGVDGKKQEMAIILHPLHPDTFVASAGMLGEYPSGRMLARDGETVVKSTDDFGEIWQVDKAYDALLFSPRLGFPFPKCIYPTESMLESTISFQIASEHCKNKEFKEMCIQDLMSTGDFEMVDLYDEEMSTLTSTIDLEE